MKRQEITIYSSEILYNISYTVLSAFYPGIAEEHKISIWVLGIIFAISPFVSIPASFVVGKYMKKLGRKCVFIFGMVLNTISMLIIVIAIYTNTVSFLLLSIISRIISGIGEGCTMNAAPCILMTESPGEMDKIITYFEVCSGLGLFLGPIIGSFISLYSLSLVFVFAAGIYLVFTIMSIFFLKINEDMIDSKSVSLMKIAFQPRLLLHFYVQFWFMFALAYLSSTIELNLMNYDLSSFIIGLIYCICTFMYFVISFIQSRFSFNIKPQVLIFFGLSLTGISFFFLGPWEVIFPKQYWIICIGLCLLGISSSLTYSNFQIVPATTHLISVAVNYYAYEYDDILFDGISAIMSISTCLGLVLGPLASGFLTHFLGFSTGYMLIGYLSLASAGIYLILSPSSIHTNTMQKYYSV